MNTLTYNNYIMFFTLTKSIYGVIIIIVEFIWCEISDSNTSSSWPVALTGRLAQNRSSLCYRQQDCTAAGQHN